LYLHVFCLIAFYFFFSLYSVLVANKAICVCGCALQLCFVRLNPSPAQQQQIQQKRQEKQQQQQDEQESEPEPESSDLQYDDDRVIYIEDRTTKPDSDDESSAVSNSDGLDVLSDPRTPSSAKARKPASSKSSEPVVQPLSSAVLVQPSNLPPYTIAASDIPLGGRLFHSHSNNNVCIVIRVARIFFWGCTFLPPTKKLTTFLVVVLKTQAKTTNLTTTTVQIYPISSQYSTLDLPGGTLSLCGALTTFPCKFGPQFFPCPGGCTNTPCTPWIRLCVQGRINHSGAPYQREAGPFSHTLS